MKKKAIFLIALLAAVSARAQQSGSEFARFLNDTQLDLTLRNHWKYLKESEAQSKEVHNAWGQAAALDFRSGWLWDALGFDATYTRAVKLGASDYFATRGMLYSHGSGFDKSNAGGFGRFGQRYLKLKLGDKTFGLTAKGGWQQLKDYGVLTNSYRLARNSYQGYSGTLGWQDLKLDAAWVERSLMFDSPNSVHFLTLDGKPIDSIFTAGLSYKADGRYLSWNYGEAKDYLRRYVAELVWPLAPQWALASQIYGSQALANYKAMPTAKKQFDDSAWHYAGELRWQEDPWIVKLGVAWTHAEKKNAVGYYDRHLGKNSRGRFNALTSAGKDYMRDGELALTTFAEYQFSKSYASAVQLNYGQFAWKNNTVRTGEVTWINRWQPADKALEHLSVFAQLGYGWSYKNNNSTPVLNAHGDYMRAPSLSAEVGVTWKFGLL
ncbi:hypothetical protein [Kalamiella sp. sgz302252]|uniref:hypothetical protein n=1 Tax=Pantoea sp. sgz302252 TaxID=3341827 RepID=UPI0036D2CAD7